MIERRPSTTSLRRSSAHERVRRAAYLIGLMTTLVFTGLAGAFSAAAEPGDAPALGPQPLPAAPIPSQVITPRLTAWTALGDATATETRPGLTALVANDDGTSWGLFGGSAADVGEQPLQLRLIRPRWQRPAAGSGAARVLSTFVVSDPSHQVAFSIRHENTRRRVLTKADVEPGALQRVGDGTLWLAGRKGAYLWHLSASGRVLDPPLPLPDGLLPGQSGGFDAMAGSGRGQYLYPIVAGSVTGDGDPRARTVIEFDTRDQRYTGRQWRYRVDTDANRVSDAQLVADGELLILERDEFEGSAAFLKRLYRVDLDQVESSGVLAKSLVVDLLKIDNPSGLGAAAGLGRTVALASRRLDAMTLTRRGQIVVSARMAAGTAEVDQLIMIDPSATAPPPVREGTVYAHRGASGYRPEHTLAAYALAIRQCADVIEPDVVMTADGVAVVRHENEIGGRRNSDGSLTAGGTTDVDAHPEFAARLTSKGVDGDPSRTARYWYTEDFTLSELRTLRTRERVPDVRPDNTAYDGLYPVPTLAEVLDLARHSRTCTGAPVAVAPETKHPSYFAGLGLPIEPALLRDLRAAELDRGGAPVIIQSFETKNLKWLATQTDVRLIQLINCSGRPWDFTVARDRRTYADLAKPAGLAEIAGYADAVGFCKNVMIPRTSAGALADAPTAAVADAHAAGLQVVGWTFRRENQFLPLQYRSSSDPDAAGDLPGEIRAFLRIGMDGYFTDNPDVAATLILD